MAHYTCPMCKEKLERDLAVFLSHTDQHVIDEIRKSHPEWIAEDGGCQKCVEYFRNQVQGKA